MNKRIIIVLAAAFTLSACNETHLKSEMQPKEIITVKESNMYQELKNYIEELLPQIDLIPAERKMTLEKIADFIRNKKQTNEPVNLTFICTHNSRRSHLSQIWAYAAAAYYRLDNIHTFSGGTEATAFNPRAVAAVERAGFRIEKKGFDENPVYKVSFSSDVHPLECFSKVYDDPFNAIDNFAAIMTCSHADENCPFIPRASLRIAIPYQDPKEADGSDNEGQVYDERCKQIAAEMFYMMSKV